jgi:hypothetical protein
MRSTRSIIQNRSGWQGRAQAKLRMAERETPYERLLEARADRVEEPQLKPVDKGEHEALANAGTAQAE